MNRDRAKLTELTRALFASDNALLALLQDSNYKPFNGLAVGRSPKDVSVPKKGANRDARVANQT